MFLHTLLIPSFSCLYRGKSRRISGPARRLHKAQQASTLPSHPISLCFSVWLWPLRQPSMKTNILPIKGNKTPQALHWKVCLVFFFMSAFTQLSQPAQVGRLALWVGVRPLLFFFFVPGSESARCECSKGRSKTKYSICVLMSSEVRWLILSVRNKLHTHVHCLKGGSYSDHLLWI